MKLFRTAILSTLLLGLSVFAQGSGDDVKVPPRKGKGKVTIITDPPNSDVYLGGELLGKSPIENKSFKAGRHTLVVVDQGHELVNERFNVWPDSVNVYSAKTVIPKGNIEVTTIPSKCAIYIDGDMADKTDGAALTVKNLDAGDHMVRAECGGNKVGEELVTVRGEETAKVQIDATAKKKKK